MDLPSPKELKKLADACRKAGICSFKGAGIEFTLTEEAPASRSRKRRGAAPKAPAMPQFEDNSPFTSDALSDEDALFWSIGQGQAIADPTGTT